VLRRASARLGVEESALRQPWSSGLLVGDTTSLSRCATPWCGRRLPGSDRGRTGAVPTGPWPRPWPAWETPTARPGTVLRRRRHRPESWCSARARRVRALRRGGYVARSRPTSERGPVVRSDHTCASDVRGSPQRVGVRTGRHAQTLLSARARSATDPLLSATSRGCGGTSRSTSGRPPRRTGSSSRPPRGQPFDPVRAWTSLSPRP
jgi:hypothetical protein